MWRVQSYFCFPRLEFGVWGVGCRVEVYVNGKWRVDGPSNVDVSGGPQSAVAEGFLFRV